MFDDNAITFDRLTNAVRALSDRADYLERDAADTHARLTEKNTNAMDRMRWTIARDVQAVVMRDHADALVSEWADIAHGVAAELRGFAPAQANHAALELAVSWTRYCNRTIAETFDRRADLPDQMIQAAKVEACRVILERLGVADRHTGLSDDDMRAVFEARARREHDRKAKAAKAELVKLAGVYRVNVFDGYGNRMAELGLCARRKADALTEGAALLDQKGWGRLSLD